MTALKEERNTEELYSAFGQLVDNAGALGDEAIYKGAIVALVGGKLVPASGTAGVALGRAEETIPAIADRLPNVTTCRIRSGVFAVESEATSPAFGDAVSFVDDQTIGDAGSGPVARVIEVRADGQVYVAIDPLSNLPE